MADKIIEEVYWIGMDNPEGRDFHGINTVRGGSYNSYLIVDDKPAIIDGTNTKFLEKYLESLKTVIEPEKIAYIIINHAEPDHAGAMKEISEACKNAKIVCTEKCKDFVIAAFGVEKEFIIVNSGDEINLGKKTLIFYPDPMVHWPETMMTYLKEDKILFSADLFGTEIAHESHWADEMKPFLSLTRDYFAIVMRPYAIAVKKAIDNARTMEISILAPSHGPLYRKDIARIVEYYEKLAVNPEDDKILIVYYSVWNSTQKMANLIAQTAIEEGFDVAMYDLGGANYVELMAQAMTSKGIALGCLTIVNNYHPYFDALFPFLRINNQKNKPAIVFGTHGWAGASVKNLIEKLKEINFNVVDSVDLRFGPRNEEDNLKVRELGKKLIQAVKEG